MSNVLVRMGVPLDTVLHRREGGVDVILDLERFESIEQAQAIQVELEQANVPVREILTATEVYDSDRSALRLRGRSHS